MPIYEYFCPKCNACFTVLRLTVTDNSVEKCPGCGSEDVKKLMSAFAVCSPGSGFSSAGQSSGFGGS